MGVLTRDLKRVLQRVCSEKWSRIKGAVWELACPRLCPFWLNAMTGQCRSIKVWISGELHWVILTSHGGPCGVGEAVVGSMSLGHDSAFPCAQPAFVPFIPQMSIPGHSLINPAC